MFLCHHLLCLQQNDPDAGAERECLKTWMTAQSLMELFDLMRVIVV